MFELLSCSTKTNFLGLKSHGIFGGILPFTQLRWVKGLEAQEWAAVHSPPSPPETFSGTQGSPEKPSWPYKPAKNSHPFCIVPETLYPNIPKFPGMSVKKIFAVKIMDWRGVLPEYPTNFLPWAGDLGLSDYGRTMFKAYWWEGSSSSNFNIYLLLSKMVGGHITEDVRKSVHFEWWHATLKS